MTIVLTGGSGFIGTALARALLRRGDTVVVVDKKGPSFTHENLFYIPCDLEKNTLPFNVLERTDAVIHLAGRTIAGRWTSSVKEAIHKSRVQSTRHVAESIVATKNKPPVFITASATGFYGDAGDRDLDEQSARGETFLARVVEEWEREAFQVEDLGVRVVAIRTAPVLGPGGFLSPLFRLARLHITAPFSKKDFWMPWIHLDDVVRIYLFALDTKTVQGVVNAVAPMPVRHHEFVNIFAKETKSLVLGSIPLARFFLGDFLREMTVSQRVHPRRLIDKGFAFSYTDLREAIESVRREHRKTNAAIDDTTKA